MADCWSVPATTARPQTVRYLPSRAAEVDPTGAGDTFLAALAASALRPAIAGRRRSRRPLDLRFAAAAGSLAVEAWVSTAFPTEPRSTCVEPRDDPARRRSPPWSPRWATTARRTAPYRRAPDPLATTGRSAGRLGATRRRIRSARRRRSRSRAGSGCPIRADARPGPVPTSRAAGPAADPGCGVRGASLTRWRPRSRPGPVA